MPAPLTLAKAESVNVSLYPALANRHGLIAGATGTGKTVSLQVLAEAFSNIGVPVFLSDVKGDLSGLAVAGQRSPKFDERLQRLGVEDWQGRASPVLFWDVFGDSGHPLRATISDFGPLLLARLLNLNGTQTGVLQLAFKVADDRGLLLIDLKDLRALLRFVGDNAKALANEYGHVSSASIGAIQRNLLALEAEGAEAFFGEPMLNIADLMRTDADGRGFISILHAERLYRAPKLYATTLLWLLAELFEQLPEVGDADKPKLVFFFDEAHLLFDKAAPALLEKIEQVVRLIRSKGVGVYFVTQQPSDLPDDVLGQLGNRVQHALRAFTPKDQKAVKTAASTMRANPAFDTSAVITELGVGEALISCLDEKGRPQVTERAFMLPPASRIGPLSPEERRQRIQQSWLLGRYDTAIDRESAYEKLQQPQNSSDSSTSARPNEQKSDTRKPEAQAERSVLGDLLLGSRGPRGGKRDGLIETAAKTAARQIGRDMGRSILRGVLGSILGGRR